MLLSVTIGLSVNSIQLALSGGNNVNATQISAFQLILGMISVLVLLVMRRLNRNISSPTADAEFMAEASTFFTVLAWQQRFLLPLF